MKKEKKGCSVKGCTRAYSARGLCDHHYKRMLRIGSTELQKDAWVDSAKRFLQERPRTVREVADALKISNPTAAKVIREINAPVLFRISPAHGGVPEPRYIYQRIDAVMVQREIVAVLRETPDLSVKEIAASVGQSVVALRRHINLLHKWGVLSIGRWTLVERIYEKLWRFGGDTDAIKPRAMTIQERNEKRRLREEIDPDLKEASRIARQRYHVRTNLKPKRDPLTAALFGSAK